MRGALAFPMMIVARNPSPVNLFAQIEWHLTPKLNLTNLPDRVYYSV